MEDTVKRTKALFPRRMRLRGNFGTDVHAQIANGYFSGSIRRSKIALFLSKHPIFRRKTVLEISQGGVFLPRTSCADRSSSFSLAQAPSEIFQMRFSLENRLREISKPIPGWRIGSDFRQTRFRAGKAGPKNFKVDWPVAQGLCRSAEAIFGAISALQGLAVDFFTAKRLCGKDREAGPRRGSALRGPRGARLNDAESAARHSARDASGWRWAGRSPGMIFPEEEWSSKKSRAC